jgi:hypothetical protein
MMSYTLKLQMKQLINLTYFLSFLLLFITEVLIALYVHDAIIRPYFGDVLVVIMIYCFVKSFGDLPVVPTAVGVLLFAYLIEILQHFNLVQHLGLADSKLANTVLGNYFTWVDMLAYTLGFLAVLGFEGFYAKRLRQKTRRQPERYFI